MFNYDVMCKFGLQWVNITQTHARTHRHIVCVSVSSSLWSSAGLGLMNFCGPGPGLDSNC